MVTLSAAEINQRRATVAALSEAELKEKTVKELKVLAAGILPRSSRMKKAELIAGLIALTQVERELSTIETKSAVKAVRVRGDDLGDYAQTFYREFRKAVEAYKLKSQSYEVLAGTLSGMAIRLVGWLKDQPGQQADGGQAESTILRNRSTLMGALRDSVEADTGIYSQVLIDCYQLLDSAVSEALRDATRRKKVTYKRDISDRNLADNRTEVDCGSILKFADRILGSLDDLKAKDWPSVVVALVIVTGRRPTEIQCTASFEKVDSHTLKFTGQTKVKGKADDFYREYPSYQIPVLIESGTVLKAMQWLQDNGKRIKKTADNAESMTHKRYSKDLSAKVKALRQAGIFPDATIEKNGKTVSKWTLKSGRSIYSHIATAIAKPGDTESYAAQILGHGRAWALDTGCYYDPETPKSYEADWRLVGEIPKLKGKGFVHNPNFYKR